MRGVLTRLPEHLHPVVDVVVLPEPPGDPAREAEAPQVLQLDRLVRGQRVHAAAVGDLLELRSKKRIERAGQVIEER